MTKILVAAEVSPDSEPRAHAVPAAGPDAAKYGVSLCGYPADHLAIVPDLEWDALEIPHRCRHCQEEFLGR